MAGKIVVVVLVVATVLGAAVWWFVDMKNAPYVGADVPHLLAGQGTDQQVVAAIKEHIYEAEQGDGDRVTALARLGMCYHAHSMLGQAATCYINVLERRRDARVLYQLARIREIEGRLDLATSFLLDVIDEDPAYLPAQCRLGRVLHARGDVDGAASAFRTVLQDAPLDLAARVGLARVLLETNDVDEARGLLESVVREHPGVEYFHQLYGAALQRSGNLEEARLHLTGTTGQPPGFNDPWVAEVRAMRTGYNATLEAAGAAIHRGNQSEALEILTEMRKRYPDDVLVLNYIANAYGLDGNEDKVMQMLRLALARDSQSVATQVNLSLSFERSNNMGKALEHAREAVGIDPTNGPAQRQLGRVCVLMQRYEEAADALGLAIDNGAMDNATRLSHAQVLSAVGKWEDARKAFERLCRRTPQDPAAIAGYARTLLELGEIDAGRAALAEATVLKADDPTVRATTARLQELTK